MNSKEIRTHNGIIRIIRGDITVEHADAIVNASNSSLRPGGGVCGVIHNAAGPTVAEDCRRVMAGRDPLEPGEAVATVAGDLNARYVIHALGPVWHGGDMGEPKALASAYRTSIEIADQLGLNSIAFPSISTGIYGYPMMAAAHVGLDAIKKAMEHTRSVREVRIVLYDPYAFDVWILAAR
ncbi:MAG: RNase III inhibitor [Actinobacteria bacterium HGW-Actinobacteria-6]|jgi:O-acetyl-ADP-ribose deacetylase (regulator of RNase III)|nr:MAG: RNase III inhibitor [Actinobacteria bacterium HGW-Actinobacteria-6]